MRDEQKSETANRERFYEDLAKRFVNDKFLDLHALTYNAVHWGGTLYARHENRYAPLTETEANCLLRQWCLTNGVAQNNRVIGNTMPIVKTLLTEDRHRHPPCLSTEATTSSPSRRTSSPSATACLTSKHG